MSANLQLDTREFEQAIRLYKKATGKDMASILNRAGSNIAFRVIRFTKRANRAQIRALVNQPWWPAFITKTLKAKNPGQKITRAEARRESRKIINARARSVGFIASGWITAMQKFAAARGIPLKTRGLKQRGRPKGSAKIATPGRLIAELRNTATGDSRTGARALNQFGNPPLQRAVRDVSRDMKRFAIRQLQKTAKKFSATVGGILR